MITFKIIFKFVNELMLFVMLNDYTYYDNLISDSI